MCWHVLACWHVGVLVCWRVGLSSVLRVLAGPVHDVLVGVLEGRQAGNAVDGAGGRCDGVVCVA